MKTTIAQFIPIIIIVSLLSYSKEFVNMSYTILGKIVAICFVLFYTHLDKYVGLVLCLLVIVYYQSEFVENMLNTDDMMNQLFENFETSKKEVSIEKKQGEKQIQEGNIKNAQLQENMSSLSDVYADTKTESGKTDKTDNNEEAIEGMTTINAFRKENCKGNQLMNKNMKVKPDMTKHIFPTVEFKKSQCNVCDSACEFSIIENRLNTEKELFSKFSRDENKPNKSNKKTECEQCT
jgi:hypothetical protein